MCAWACADSGTPGPQDPRTPGPQDPRTPGPQDPRTPAAGRAGVLGSWGPGVLGSWGPGVPGTWGLGVPGTWGPGLLGVWSPWCPQGHEQTGEHRRVPLPAFSWRPPYRTPQCDGVRLAARCCLMGHQPISQHAITVDLTRAWPQVHAGACVRASVLRSRESSWRLHAPAVSRRCVRAAPGAPVIGITCSLTGLSRQPYGYWPYALTN